jgi:Flp pilus assembly protein TadD
MATIAEAIQLALQHHRQGQFVQAEQIYRQVLQADPRQGNAWHLLGVVEGQMGRHDAACDNIKRAITLNPREAVYYSNLGHACRSLGRLDEAVASYREAVRIKPDFAQAHYDLGVTLQMQEETEQAVASYRRAIQLRPDYSEAHNNLGTSLQKLGRIEEALACFDQVIAREPEVGDGHFNRAIAWLLTGDFARGFPEYEWRWRNSTWSPRLFQQPRWDGSPQPGRAIYLFAEQGLGDTLQFVRYAPRVKERVGTVVVECQPTLVKLLANCPGVDLVTSSPGMAPPFQLQAALMSLPGIFGTTLATIPAQVPYLIADADMVAAWRAELNAVNAIKVGIAWRGNPQHPMDALRGIPLTFFGQLARVPHVKLYSLQKGPGREELTESRSRFPIIDLTDRLSDFQDTAAILKNLDLVISCDTAVVHLAGALAVPAWVALPFAPDWRWLLEREDSPWYPTIRLFRQRRAGDWQDVFERLEQALRKGSGVRGQGSAV